MILRAGDIGFFLFERSKKSGLRRILIVLFLIACLVLVAGKVKIVQLGYQIEALEREKKELERENRSLRIEASSLASSARIEELATKRMGMIRPPKENIVVVKRKTPPAQ